MFLPQGFRLSLSCFHIIIYRNAGMEFTYLMPAKILPLAQWFCTQTLPREVKTNLLRNRAAGASVLTATTALRARFGCWAHIHVWVVLSVRDGVFRVSFLSPLCNNLEEFRLWTTKFFLHWSKLLSIFQFLFKCVNVSFFAKGPTENLFAF